MPPLHLLLIGAICLAWGFNFIASAAALEHWPPFLFTIIRFVIVLVVLLPFMRLPPSRHWRRLITVCLLNGALHFGFFFVGLQLSSDISSVAVAVQCYVPMSAILAMLMLGERVGLRSGTAIAVAFAGVAVIGFDPQVLSQLDALAFTLLAAFCMALATILMRRLDGLDPMSYQAWTAIISIPALLIGTLVFETPTLSMLIDADWIPWAGAAYSALAASIFGHGLFFYWSDCTRSQP